MNLFWSNKTFKKIFAFKHTYSNTNYKKMAIKQQQELNDISGYYVEVILSHGHYPCKTLPQYQLRAWLKVNSSQSIAVVDALA